MFLCLLVLSSIMSDLPTNISDYSLLRTVVKLYVDSVTLNHTYDVIPRYDKPR